ncbi:hypothetical protein [Zavarzinia aquatilis]|uniref:hypothetical protein n=1 Tax=Zavarzinia aquatilis TaxID=2211142 RepID=UPI001057C0ED|nr:hypothetical protein [Zavarzinia aquatilis]
MQRDDGVWDFVPYFAYLETIRGQLPAPVHAFATDEAHYSFSSPTSLHDASLKSLVIREIEGDDGRRTSIVVETCYLGPQGDRDIHITYGGVVGYDLHYAEVRPETHGYRRPPVHGDIIAHEIRIDRPGIVTHEIHFADGAGFTIHFTSFEHKVTAVAPARP